MPRTTTPPLTLYMQPGAVVKGLSRGRFWRNGRPTVPTLVLLYIAETGVRILSPMEIRSWLREQFNVDLDRRRIHDAFRKLEQLRILERIRRGLYKVVNIAKALAELARRLHNSNGSGRVSDCTPGTTGPAWLGSCAGRGARRGSRLVWDGGCVVVFRDHRRLGGGVDPVGLVVEGLVRAGFLWRVYQLVERAYAGLLRRLGYSGYRIRRLRSRARRLFEAVASRAVVRIGAHAREKGVGPGRFYVFEEFARLVAGNPHPEAKFKEFGVDVVVCPGDGGGSAGGGGAGGEELEELEALVRELRDVIGWAQVYVPLNGAGSRR